MNILHKIGLSIETLEKLSYQSDLGVSFKRTIPHFKKEEVLLEINRVIQWYVSLEDIDEIPLASRVKSYSSAKKKLELYPQATYNRVFNDLLGFRAICDSYEDVLSLNSEKKIKLVDMSHGKMNDDGYRGVHVYFQLDNYHYPIEIQFNTKFDRQLNDWLHDKVYKLGYDNFVGQQLRSEYESGKIRTVDELEEGLNNVLYSSKKI